MPLAIILGPGNEHDSKRFEQTVGSIRINTDRGRPRNKPKEVLADAAYDTESIRIYLRKRGIKCSIPENKRNQKKTARGRPTRFGWLKSGFRRIATRYERLDDCFLGLICLAAFLIIWRKIGVLR